MICIVFITSRDLKFSCHNSKNPGGPFPTTHSLLYKMSFREEGKNDTSIWFVNICVYK